MTGGVVGLLLVDVALGALLLWWLLDAGYAPTRRQAVTFGVGLAVLVPLLAATTLWWLSGR